MNIVFMGTPDFAVPSLKILIENFNVKAVITQPDRPKGRGKKVSMSPVKEEALKYNIPVYQPKNIKKDEEVIQNIKDLNPDFIIVVAFGQILSKKILGIPKKACINVHASLLPKYRGAAPINFSILNGEKETGVTTMLMGEGLDTGDMLLKDKISINNKINAGELHDILMEKGAELLLKTIIDFDNIIPEKQDDDKSNYASMINKKMGKINWNKSSEHINNLIRGLNPWPVAYTSYKDKNMKIYECKILEKKSGIAPGTIIDVNNDGIRVATEDKDLLLTKIQFPGKKAMEVCEFIKGNEIEKSEILK